MKEKECTKCGEKKTLDKFHRQKRGKYGRRADCAMCSSSYGRKYYWTGKGIGRWWNVDEEPIRKVG